MTEEMALVDLEFFIRALALLLAIRLVAAILPSVSAPKPPLSVRVVGYSEFAFGTIIALPLLIELFLFIPFAAFDSTLTLLGLLIAVGLAWDILAIQLLMGRTWARHTYLILSVVRLFALIGLPFPLAKLWLFSVRVFTLIGIPFSLVGLYVLCRNDAAKAFFTKADNTDTQPPA